MNLQTPYYHDDASGITIYNGDSREIIPILKGNFDSIVTDPPYEIGFIGKKWDSSGISFSVNLWRDVLRVLKPGAHLLAFGGSRTHHRMVCAIEDAGFEIRDEIQWLYGNGFPKSLDVSKAIEKAAGVERTDRVVSEYANNDVFQPSVTIINSGTPVTPESVQWQGWGTALKPACEPICVARKPLIGTVAANVLAHGTGAINVEAGRIAVEGGKLAENTNRVLREGEQERTR